MSVPSTERWLPIPGFDGYEVSDLGRVVSYRRPVPHLLAVHPNPQGYLTVRLQRDGLAMTRVVHSLVAEAFHGPRPAGQVVRHLNGDQLNNCPQNLAWGDPAENVADTKRHGHNYWSNKTHCPAGHPYSPENTYTWRAGRACRTCRRANNAARKLAARV